VQKEVDTALAEMKASLAKQVKALEDLAGGLGGGTNRLVGAGQALLAYLGERDRWLERERDRVLHEVLDEFAQGLSAKERRAVSSRMGEALDRRRDARDAGRFRRTEAGQPAIEIPEVPAEIAALNEPVVPAPLPPAPTARQRASAPSVARATTPARKSTVAKKAEPVKKTASKTASKSATAPTSSAAKKAPPAGRSPAQTGAKRASSAKTAAKKTSSSSTRSR
jgi:type IV secretory pathway VirB10-like protein